MSSLVSKKRPSTDGNRTPSDLNRPSTHDPASSPVRKKQASMSGIRTLSDLNHSFTQDSMSSSGSKAKPLTSGIRTLSDLNRTSTQNSNNNSDNPQQHHAVVEKRQILFLWPYNFFIIFLLISTLTWILTFCYFQEYFFPFWCDFTFFSLWEVL